MSLTQRDMILVAQGSDRGTVLNAAWLRELWRYRELFLFMVWRDIKVRYKQTVLGALWAIIQPFAQMVVFTLFFNKMAGIGPEGIPYPIFSYSAVLPWTYFSGTLNNSGNSLVGNRDLITKVYFPRVTIPASPVLAALLDFAIASSILLGMMVYYGVGLSWPLMLCPVLVALLVLLTLGVGMILASLNVRYRDVKYAIPFVIQLWLFLTPVIYPSSDIPERFQPLLALNPLTGIIEAFRAAILNRPDVYPLDWQALGVSTVMTVIILAVGLRYFTKTERSFADII